MKVALFFFLAFGCIGITTEIFFTAIYDSIISLQEGRAIDWRLVGTSYVWMFPIYGLAGIIFPAGYLLVKKEHFFIRMNIYGVAIIILEFITGALLDFVTGRCPWEYKTGWHVKGYIRIDYFPLWALFGYMNELIYLFLERNYRLSI